jgi:hypothetical protein
MCSVYFILLFVRVKKPICGEGSKKEERKQYLQRLREAKRNEIITKTNVSFTHISCYSSVCSILYIQHIFPFAHLFFCNRDRMST